MSICGTATATRSGIEPFPATRAPLKRDAGGLALLTLSMRLKMATSPQIPAGRVLLALRWLELRLGAQG